MRRLISLLVFVAILAGIGVAVILVVKPPFAAAWFPGVYSKHYEEQLRQRFTALAKHVVADDLEQCVDFAAPSYLQEHGRQSARNLFRWLTGPAKALRLTEADIRLDKITVHPELHTAELEHSVRVFNTWGKPQLTKWVRVGGQWYLGG